MRRIRSKLVGATVVAFASVALVSGAVLRAWSAEEREQQYRDELTRHAMAVAALLAEVPITPGAALPALQQAAQALHARTGLRVTFIASDGQVVVDSDVRPADLGRVANHAERPEVRAALDGRTGTARRRSATVGRSLVYAAVPHAAGGVVRIAGPPRTGDTAGRWALVWAAAILATALVTRAVVRSIATEPLDRIETAVSALAGGDLAARTGWTGDDELGRLAAGIDQLASDLETRLREVTEEKEQLHAVLSGMVEGVLVLDESGRILLANPRLQSLLGMRGETVGKRPIEAIRHAGVEEALADAAGSDAPIVREIRLGADEPRVLRVHASGFSSADGTGVVAVFHDITEIRRIEAVRRDFVTNASHELRTPLTAIRGFAETLLREGVGETERRRYLDIILRHADRLSQLVEDLLELSRAESSRLPLRTENVRLAEIASTVLTGLTARSRERGIETGLRVDEDVSAMVDPVALEQILVNLLDNALKYTDPGGRVELSVGRAPDGRARVSVADTGIGIPAGDRDRIFERFYRADKARSREMGGTGLGLSIVRHLCAAMGGTVGVESTPGVGSTFRVDLPAKTSY